MAAGQDNKSLQLRQLQPGRPLVVPERLWGEQRMRTLLLVRPRQVAVASRVCHAAEPAQRQGFRPQSLQRARCSAFESEAGAGGD